MRVIIYGAGAIGGVVGCHLARAGSDVVLICRPGHANAINEHGLRFITPTGSQLLQIPAVVTPDQINFRSEDVVFLCVKSQDTDEALRNLRTVIEDVPLFCFQNGIRNEEIASRYFPRVYGVRVVVGGIFLNNGEVMARRDPPGSLIMGHYPTGTDELVETVAATLRAAEFYTLVSPDVMPYKWGKLLRNLGNAIGAITNSRGDEINPIVRAARHEAEEVLAQAGIRWISTQEEAQEWPESTIKPRSVMELEAKSSTWQSLARQQGTVETDFLNGEIVRLAERLGIRAPANKTLLRISQEMAARHELPGKYSTTELSRMLGLV